MLGSKSGLSFRVLLAQARRAFSLSGVLTPEYQLLRPEQCTYLVPLSASCLTMDFAWKQMQDKADIGQISPHEMQVLSNMNMTALQVHGHCYPNVKFFAFSPGFPECTQKRRSKEQQRKRIPVGRSHLPGPDPKATGPIPTWKPGSRPFPHKVRMGQLGANGDLGRSVQESSRLRSGALPVEKPASSPTRRALRPSSYQKPSRKKPGERS